jgi:hypothetical protein
VNRFVLTEKRLPPWARPFLAGAEIVVDDRGAAVLVLGGEESVRFPTLDHLLSTYRLNLGQLEPWSEAG